MADDNPRFHLHEGEFVLSADAVRKYGERHVHAFMAALNQGPKPPPKHE